MNSKNQKKGRPALGRGLSALISSAAVPVFRNDTGKGDTVKTETERSAVEPKVIQASKIVSLPDPQRETADESTAGAVQYVAIASVTGFMFLFVGIVDVFVALANRTGLWWLRLVTGFVCIGLAFWASGDFDRKAVLLVVWVGLFALFRGISSYVVAFTLRHLHKELSAH